MNLVVTGSSGVLGKAVVMALIAQGHAVAALDCTPGDHATAPAVQVIVADLADPDMAAVALRQARETLGAIDGVIHLAGGFDWRLFGDSNVADWRRLFSTNVETSVATIGAALPLMADGGAILCVGAASAQPAGAGMGAYAAAKSGVARLVEALSIELRERRIRANAILPSIIDTPRNRADMPDADFTQWTSPAAIADAVAFLISPAARAINGASIPVTNAA